MADGAGVRITTGRHRRRRLTVPAGAQVRPTADRTRQALFNMLAHGGLGTGDTGDVVRTAHVLDLYAGTGALGLEALSRGASHVLFVEQAAVALDALNANIISLGETAAARILVADASRLVRRPAGQEPVDLVFLDPPYGADMIGPTLAALADGDWLAAGAMLAVECAAGNSIWQEQALHLGYDILRRRTHGAADIVIVRWTDTEGSPASSAGS